MDAVPQKMGSSCEKRDLAAAPLHPLLWVATTYFAQGFPLALVRSLASIYFVDIGQPLSVVGYLNWIALPWNLKFLWSSWVDLFFSSRAWLVGTQFVLACLCTVLALLVYFQPFVSWLVLWRVAFVVTLACVAVVSATHDIAIDAYYMARLTDKSAQAAYSGLRIAAYRSAVVVVKFGLVGLLAWRWNFALAALLMAALTCYHARYLPRIVTGSLGQRKLHGHWLAAFISYFDKPRLAVVLAFILTYKLGDELLFSMSSAFLLRELQLTKSQLSWVSGLLGTLATVLGSVIAGRLIARYGLKRMMMPLTLFMNLNISVYWLLAFLKPSAHTSLGLLLISLAHGYEFFAAGCGNTCLMVFLLYTCHHPHYKAAHYTIGTALMGILGLILSGFAGKIVAAYGYVALYSAALLAAVPATLLIPFLPLDWLMSESRQSHQESST